MAWASLAAKSTAKREFKMMSGSSVRFSFFTRFGWMCCLLKNLKLIQ